MGALCSFTHIVHAVHTGGEMKCWYEARPINEEEIAHNLDYSSQKYCKEMFNFSRFGF